MISASVTKRQIPVEVDVELLQESFPREELVVGQIIPYEAIEAVLNLTRKTHPHRFQAVVGAWRRALLIESGIAFLTLVNVGYKVANDRQKLSLGDNYRTQSLRRLKRSAEHYNAINTENLTDDEKRSLSASIRSNSSVLTALAMKRELPKPQI